MTESLTRLILLTYVSRRAATSHQPKSQRLSSWFEAVEHHVFGGEWSEDRGTGKRGRDAK